VHDALDPLWLTGGRSLAIRSEAVNTLTAEKSTRSSGASVPRTDRRFDWPAMVTLREHHIVFDPSDRRPDGSPLAIAARAARMRYAMCLRAGRRSCG
jgi:hypothetical protein